MIEMVYLLATLCVLLVCAVGALAFALHQTKKSLDEITEESMLSSRDAALERRVLAALEERVLARTFVYVRDFLENHYDRCHSKTDVL